MPLQQRQPRASWAALGSAVSRSRGAVLRSFPCTWHWWDHSWSAASSSGLPSTRKRSTYWRKFAEGPRWWLRNWSIQPTKRGWETGLFRLQKLRLRQGDLICVKIYLMAGSKVAKARLFSVVSSDRTRGNRHKIQQSPFKGKNPPPFYC